MNHRIVERSGVQNPLLPTGHTNGTVSSAIKPNARGENKISFVEDFNMEHSASGISVTWLSAAASDSARPGRSRSARAHQKSAPSCIYLG
jgi:hypothetical protein